MSEFKREDRYIVIKRSDLKKVPVAYRSALVDPMLSLLSHLPRREFVVVEHDWPEYHLVWAMIEHRMAGKPVPDFDLWRRANELQELLNQRDEQLNSLEQRRYAEQQAREAAERRVEELTAQQTESRVITLSGCEFSEHELLRTAVRMVTGTSRRGTLRWVAMKDAFCCGSGVAHALCRRFGFDPDETVKP